MKYGFVAKFIPKLLDKTIYSFLSKEIKDFDFKTFKKKHKKEYKEMVKRTPGIGSAKENSLYSTYYIACYGFSIYKADPENITVDIFDRMIDDLLNSPLMKKAYEGKDAFDEKTMKNYEKGAKRSEKNEYPMDWKYTFLFNKEVPEYFLTYSECALCKLAKREHVEFLMSSLCKMDYKSIELKGAKLIRTKTIGNGDECCDFHVVR